MYAHTRTAQPNGNLHLASPSSHYFEVMQVQNTCMMCLHDVCPPGFACEEALSLRDVVLRNVILTRGTTQGQDGANALSATVGMHTFGCNLCAHTL